MDFSPTQKAISVVSKIVVILSAVLGTFLSAYAGRHSFMGGRTISIALICAGCGWWILALLILLLIVGWP